MAKHFPDIAKINLVHQHIGGEAVAEGMGVDSPNAGLLPDLSFVHQMVTGRHEVLNGGDDVGLEA